MKTLFGILLNTLVVALLLQWFHRKEPLKPVTDLWDIMAAQPPDRSRTELVRTLHDPAQYAMLSTDERIKLALEFIQQIKPLMDGPETLKTREFLYEAIMGIVPVGEEFQ